MDVELGFGSQSPGVSPRPAFDCGAIPYPEAKDDNAMRQSNGLIDHSNSGIEGHENTLRNR
jgi:hypothetical protein